MNLLHSHYGINSSSRVRIKDLEKLLLGALKKERETWAWDMWLTKFPRMTEETFISFEDYKKELFKPKIQYSTKTPEEIIAEMMPVMMAHEKR